MNIVSRLGAFAVVFLLLFGTVSASSFSVSTSTDWRNQGTFFGTTESDGFLSIHTGKKELDYFDDGDYDGWSGDTGYASIAGGAVGSGSLHVTSGNSGKWMRREFEAINSTNMSFWVWTDTPGNHDTQYNIYDTNGEKFSGVNIDANKMTIPKDANTVVSNVNASTWYRLQYKNIDYVNNTYDVVVYNINETQIGSVSGIRFGGKNSNTDVNNFSEFEVCNCHGNLGPGHNVRIDQGWYDSPLSSGNWTGVTQVLGTSKSLDAFQVNVTGLPSGSHLDAIVEAKDTTNTTIDTEICHISSANFQNLTCANDLADFDNLRWSFNMTLGSSSPKLASSTAFYSPASSPDTDAWVNESGDKMTGNLDLGGNSLANVLTITAPDQQIALGADILWTDDTSIRNVQKIDVWRLDNNGGFDDAITLFAPFDMSGHDILNVGSVTSATLYDLEVTSFGNCDATKAGQIRYNDSGHWGCHGGNWHSLY